MSEKSCDTKNTCACAAAAANVQDPAKRDFMVLAASATAGIGAACAGYSLIASMEPADDVRAMSSTEVDISGIAPGQEKRVTWQGKTVFVRHRTPEEIKEAEADDKKQMIDPATDASRVKAGKDEWLVLVGICTHLGCIPNRVPEGWFCPCHGSHYDDSGRIRQGPAPKNLAVPPYKFISDTKIMIG